ncbi:FAD/NAD(P)-binding protein, partial [Corynebacterium variabile]
SEIAATQPESHPSRALYGEYLRWVLSVVLARIPGNLKVEVHQARATEITQVTGDDGIVRDEITLEHHTSGDAAHLASSPVTVVADATVLALGWTGNEPDGAGGVHRHQRADAPHAALGPPRQPCRPGGGRRRRR